MKENNTLEEKNRKYNYLSSIKTATINKKNNFTVVNIVEGDGRQCEIIYQEGTSNMAIYAINIVGRRTKLRPRLRKD